MLSIWVVPQVIILSHIAFDMGQFFILFGRRLVFCVHESAGKAMANHREVVRTYTESTKTVRRTDFTN